MKRTGRFRGDQQWCFAPLALLATRRSQAVAISGTVGNDISWPQCGQPYPARPAFGVVGVNDGRPYTANPCLVQEDRWASASGVVEFYMNTANPGVAAPDAYAYGFDAARDAYGSATAQVNAGPGHEWWLDVETGNSWSGDQAANSAVIAGSVGFFQGRGIWIGIYSTRYQWGVITGGASMPLVPTWVPGAQSAAEAPSFCAARQSFTARTGRDDPVHRRLRLRLPLPGGVPSSAPPASPPPPPNLVTALSSPGFDRCGAAGRWATRWPSGSRMTKSRIIHGWVVSPNVTSAPASRQRWNASSTSVTST